MQQYRRMAHSIVAAGVAVAVGLLALPAEAPAQTPSSVVRGGFAGPVGQTARVVGSNPSAMGLIDGISADFHHTLQLRSQRVETGGRQADMFRLQSDPSVAFASDLGTDLIRLGFIGAVPRRYGSAWPSDGPQRYDSIFHRVRDIHLTAGGSFSPVDWLHVGASASFVQAELRSYRAVDMAPLVARQEGADPDSVPRQHPTNEGREFLDVNGRSLGWAAGVTLTPGDLRIGAAYHGAVPLEMEGSYEIYIPKNDYYEERYGGNVNRDATVETRSPDRLTAGVGWDFDDRIDVFAQATWTRWSSVDELAVEVEEGDADRSFDRRERYDLNDTIELRLGGKIRPWAWLALDATVGFESAAIPVERLTARVVDTPRVSAAVGARFQIVDGVALRTGYQHVYHPRQATDPGADQPGTAGTYGQNLGLVETSVLIDLP